MDNYMQFEAFNIAANNATLCKILKGGYIKLSGRKYYSDELIPWVGGYVKAFIDLDGADAVCLTIFKNEYFCIAQNPEMWAVMIDELNNQSLSCNGGDNDD